jgi:hypothetical protein
MALNDIETHLNKAKKSHKFRHFKEFIEKYILIYID